MLRRIFYMKQIDYDYINNIENFISNEYIVYGMGHHGKKVRMLLSSMGVRKIEIIDKNIQASVDARRMLNDDDTIVITASNIYHSEMNNILENFGSANLKVCSFYAFMMAVFLNRDKVLNNESLSDIERDYELQCICNPVYVQGYFCDQHKRAICDDLPIILTAGKVGSRSIWKGLNEQANHIHSVVLPYSFEMANRQKLDTIRERTLKKKKKIISVVRNPFKRDISAFLQNTDLDIEPWFLENHTVFLWYGDYINNEKKYTDIYKDRFFSWEVPLEKTCEKFLDSIVKYRCDEFSWFDYEIKGYFGIDVYASEFDKERGYKIYQNEGIELLVLKLEKLNELSEVISEFVGRPFSLVNTNTGEEKVYKNIYDELKKRVAFKDAYLGYYRNNKKALHFYTEEELDNWRI